MDGWMGLEAALRLLGSLLFLGLVLQSWRMRRAVGMAHHRIAEAEAQLATTRADVKALADQVGSFASNMSLLTSTVHELGALVRHQAADTQRRFDDLASRGQIETIVRTETQYAALMLMGLRPPPHGVTVNTGPGAQQGGLRFEDRATVEGPAIGGDVGTLRHNNGEREG